jgi:hypothetical protein
MSAMANVGGPRPEPGTDACSGALQLIALVFERSQTALGSPVGQSKVGEAELGSQSLAGAAYPASPGRVA